MAANKTKQMCDGCGHKTKNKNKSRLNVNALIYKSDGTVLCEKCQAENFPKTKIKPLV